MSPNVGNFVHDLVEMAKATERLPGLERELEKLQAMVDEQAKHVQRLEMRLHDKSNEIAALHSTNRDLEVARDDAELRFLEANDRTERALDFIKTQFGAAGGLIQSLEPPKPEPEPVKEEPKAEEVQAQPVEPKPDPFYPWLGQGEDPPTQSAQSTVASANAEDPATSVTGTTSSFEGQSDSPPTQTVHTPDVATGDATETSSAEVAGGNKSLGQSATLPTAALPIEGSTVPIQSVPPQAGAGSPQQPDEGQSEDHPTASVSADATPQTSAEASPVSTKSLAVTSGAEPKPLGRFHGKRYYDHPVWVSLQDWLAEGGTEADYQWRPEARSAGF